MKPIIKADIALIRSSLNNFDPILKDGGKKEYSALGRIFTYIEELERNKK